MGPKYVSIMILHSSIFLKYQKNLQTKKVFVHRKIARKCRKEKIYIIQLFLIR